MAKILSMPKIGVNMTDGTVTEWYVKEGGQVTFGEIALAAETDKDVQDIPADQTGTVLKILAQIGDNVECHNPLAIVGEPGENIEQLLAELSGTKQSGIVQAVNKAETLEEKSNSVKQTEGRIPVSPLAKKMASEKGINLADVEYKGARITKADIIAYKEKPKATQTIVPQSLTEISYEGKTQAIPYKGIRKKIGDRLTESVLTKPWAAITVAVDMTNVIGWRSRINSISEEKVGLNVLFAKATARALQVFPNMNALLAGDGTEILVSQDVNIGIAVNTDRGLMVPVLKQVQQKGIKELSEEFTKVSERTIRQTNLPGDLSGGTFTISNLGNRGVTSFRAVINPPECAILAVATTIKTPVVINDEIVIRPMLNLTLSFDHRIVDGDYAAQFIAYLGKILEDPMMMLL
jgi:pyruvate dehydrogenase E2 component (dihydrolipoamide acetyltransferase)